MTKEPLVIYWAPAVDPEQGEWNLMYPEPTNLYKDLMDDKNPNRGLTSYLLCPAASQKFKKTWSIGFPMDAEYTYDFTDIDVPVMEATTKEYVSFSVLRPHTINAGPTVEFAYNYIFFAEEPVNAVFTPPMFHKAKYTNYASTVPGNFDIGKWFRGFPMEVQVWGNKGTIKFEQDEPVFYVEFDTDRDVILKRFKYTTELANYSKHCRTFYNQEYSLDRRYDQFQKTKTDKLILKAIKENTLD